MATPIITVHDLRKHFKVYKHHRGSGGVLRNLFSRQFEWVRAVDGVAFEIAPGELVGYLGPNGAGKSTTIKMLTGLLVPTGGELRVNGLVPWRKRREHVATIGAVFGQRTSLWWDLPTIESLSLLQYIYKVPAQRFRRNLDEFRVLLDLDPFLDTPVRSLSLGQRMRADICAALLHDPPLLFLDEPTIGLDVVAKERIRQFIQHINRDRGTTVILTTHDMDDIEALCSRVMVIGAGSILSDGPLEALRAKVTRERRLIVDLVEADRPISDPDAEVVSHDGHRVCLRFDPERVPAAALIARITAAHAVRDLFVENPPIEEIVARIYGDRRP